MISRLGLAALVSGVALALPAPAMAAPAAASPAASPSVSARGQVGTAIGSVLTAKGRPLAGVCVTAQPAGDQPQAPTRTVVTSRTGLFALASLAPGLYDLSYRNCATDLRTRAETRAFVAGDRVTMLASVRAATADVVSSAMPRRPAGRELRVGDSQHPGADNQGGISGLVLGPHGKHLAGLCYSLIVPHAILGGMIGPRGRYNTRKFIPPGKYLVEFTPHCDFESGVGTSSGNWAPQWYKAKFRQSAANAVTVKAGKILKSINGVMRPGGVITGTVTGASGHGLAGVCVVLTSRNGIWQGQITTRADGRYRFEGLDPAKYQVGFFPHCGRASQYLPQWWPNKASESRAGLVKVGFGTQREHVDARLAVGGTISGTVKFRTRHGKPLRDICVEGDTAGQSFGFDTRTDAKGSYVVHGLPSGRYSISFFTGCGNEGNFLSRNYSHPVTVQAGQIRTGIDVVLQPGGIATGRVIDKADGKPLSGICVIVGEGQAAGETGRGGTFSVDQIPPGKYEVEFQNCQNHGSFAPQYYDSQLNQGAASQVGFRSGRTTARLDAAMTPGATISGTVTLPSGRRPDGVCVTAVAGGAGAVFGPDAILFGESITQTTDGQYSLKDLPAGQYQIAFNGCDNANVATSWYKGHSGPSTADRITVAAGAVVSHVDDVLRPAGTIVGKVTGPPGQQAIVCVMAASREAQLPDFEFSATELPGQYIIGDLPPGSYTVEFEACGGGNVATQWYDRADRIGAARHVKVIAGRTTRAINADLVLGGSVSGKVVAEATGKPLSGVCVSAGNVSQPISGFALSDRSGRYRITGLNAGTYHLTFSSCLTGHLRQVVTSRFRVTARHTTSRAQVALAVLRVGEISGRVKAGTPHPAAIPGACVQAIPVAGPGIDASEGVGTANRSGFYTITDLVPGRYKVLFGDHACPTDPGGLVPQWYLGKSSSATAKILTVHADRTIHVINAVLKPDGWIAGLVTAPANSGLAGICVRAISVAGSQSPLLTMTSSDGHYLLGPLDPGRYRVKFSADCGAPGFATQWWRDARTAAEATPVLVRTGKTHQNINASMAPAS